MDNHQQQTLRFDFPAPDPEKPYVYPDTQTLINHFGIRNLYVLQRVVDTVAGLRDEQLENEPVSGDFDLAHLCAIHHVLFQDIFAWAGQVRIVDTGKKGQEFLPAVEIPGSFQVLHDQLKAENFLRDLNTEEFADRLAHYWYGVYVVHVFRDGNSRSMRHFFNRLAASAGYRLDYAAIEQLALQAACRKRYFKDDRTPLRDCFRKITCRV